MVTFSSNKKDLKQFAYEVYKMIKQTELPVFLCVGSDKFVCDSLAPIVSEMLKKKYCVRAYVYGGLDYNINAHNLNFAVNYIRTQHPTSKIILIDATLGSNVGSVLVGDGAYAGMGKALPIKKIGDGSILGVVGRQGKEFKLNTTRLGLIMQMAKFIAKGIAMADYVGELLEVNQTNDKMYL